MSRIEYEAGQVMNTFGTKYVEELDPISYGKSGDRRFAKFLCPCGNLFNGVIDGVKRGSISSCGCLNDKNRRESGKKRATHRMTGTRTYHTWQRMKARCLNTGNKDFSEYGGRGILVCERWLNSFENFLEDMGVAPDNMSLDRIDVNGNYEPSNCRWATDQEQAWNQRIYKTNKSGKSGVTWNKKAGRWESHISKDGKEHYLGFYTNPEEAIIAREKAEMEMYGYIKH